jgi:hypothetical protein
VLRREVRFDVSASVEGIGPLEVAATIAGAPDVVDAERIVVIVALPGGGYNRHYWDLQPPGRPDYSCAAHWAERGMVVVACDYLGGGDSSVPADGDLLSIPALASAAHLVHQQVRTMTMQGTLLHGLAPARTATFVGVGQSLGGHVTVAQQGEYHDYDLIATFGATAYAVANVERPSDGDLPVHVTVDRGVLGSVLHGDDVPEDLVAYDEVACQTTVPRMAAMNGWTPGFVRPYAARIQVPVFLGFGQSDLSGEPHREPSAYTASSDVTLTVFPRMAHMHNFAGTRIALWDRCAEWITCHR